MEISLQEPAQDRAYNVLCSSAFLGVHFARHLPADRKKPMAAPSAALAGKVDQLLRTQIKEIIRILLRVAIIQKHFS